MLFNRDEIYTDIKRRFVAMGYDFEDGSNIQQISQSMAYLISMMNANTAINIKETLLSSATRKDMIVEDARVLGYEPSPRVSYRYKLVLEVKNTTNAPQKFRLDKFDKFTSGDNTYYFMEDTPYIHPTTTLPNTTTLINPTTMGIIVKEGELKTSFPYDYDTSDPTLKHVVKQVQGFSGEEGQSVFDIPYKNVEADGIFAIVVNRDDDQNVKYYSRTKTSAYMLDGEDIFPDNFVRQDVVPFYTPRVHFKFANVGNPLNVGDSVFFNVLMSKGADGAASGKIENMPKFDKTGSLIVETVDMEYCSNNSNFEVTVKEVHLMGIGSERESDQSIIENAPSVNNSLNRLVTFTDYKSVCSTHAWIKDAAVWDGYDEVIKKKGKIYFSFVPNPIYRKFIVNELNCQEGNEFWELPETELLNQQNWYMDSSVDSNIDLLFKKMYNYNIPTIELKYRQPIYLDFEFKVFIAQYNTQQSASTSNNQIFTAISNYFNSEYIDSKFVKPSFGGETYNNSRVLDGKFNLKYNDLIGKKETFGSFYHNSEMTDYISDNITHGTTFNVTFDNYININSKHIFSLDGNDIITFTLGTDFKPLINEDTGEVIFDNIPHIKTLSFISDYTLDFDYSVNTNIKDNCGNDIFVPDFTHNSEYDLTCENDFVEPSYFTNLYLIEGATRHKVGVYRILNRKKTVEITLFADGNNISFLGETYTSILNEFPNSLNSDKRIKIVYPSQNLSVYKNTIPRFKSLEIRR